MLRAALGAAGPDGVGAERFDVGAGFVNIAGAVEADPVEEGLPLGGLDEVRLALAPVVTEPDGDRAVLIALARPPVVAVRPRI